jgi:hypothetical protein
LAGESGVIVVVVVVVVVVVAAPALVVPVASDSLYDGQDDLATISDIR